jgi:transglutaminase-like putative cysteine protease
MLVRQHVTTGFARMIHHHSEECMYRIAIACLAVLLGTATIPAAPPGEAPVEEFWEAAHLDGVKVGSLHTTVRAAEGEAGKILRTTAEFELSLRRGNAMVRLGMEQGTDETPEGRVVAVSMRQEQGPQRLVLAGKLEDGKMHVLIDGGRIERRLRWADDVAGLYRREHLFQEKKPKPGDRFVLPVYDPEVNAVVSLRVAVKEPEEVSVLGTRRKLMRVEMVPDKLEGPGFSVQRPTTVVWLDDAFVPVRRQIELDGLGAVILTRTTREVATAAPGDPSRVTDINARNLVPLNRGIPGAHTARAAVYRVTLRDDPDPASAFVSDGHQDVKNLRGQTFDVHVHPVRPSSPRASPDPPGPEFLGSSHFLDCDAPVIRDLARRAAADEKDAWRKAQRIERWVKTSMRVDNGAAFAPASQAARDLRGDCRQYALLTAALCRAEGVPARTALGLVYVEKTGRPYLGFHMWAEVWVDGQWRGLDACLGPVGVGHVKVSDHSWHDTASQTPLLPVARVLGKATIEVVSIDAGD